MQVDPETHSVVIFPGDLDATLEQDDDFKIHLRVQKRSARKSVTVVEGFPEQWDAKKIVRALKRTLSCNGAIKSATEDDEGCGQVIQLTGDQRHAVLRFLVEQKLCTAKQCEVHGY